MTETTANKRRSSIFLYLSLILTVCIVLAICIGGTYYLDHTAQQATARFSEMKTAIQQDDWNSALEILDESFAYWNSRKTFWQTFLDHQKVDTIETSYLTLSGFLQSQSYPDALSQLNLLNYNLLHIPEMERITFANIL